MPSISKIGIISKKYKWESNLALLVLSVLVSCISGEILLRILMPPQLSLSYQPCIYIPDARLGYRYKPNTAAWIHRGAEIRNLVRTNSLGFHDVEHRDVHQQPRLLALGDSYTAALHVATPQTWTQVVQRELRKPGYPSFEIINLGVDGTGLDAHEAILRNYLPVFRPRVVILAFYENDIDDISKGRIFKECYRGHVLAYQSQDQRDKLRVFADAHKPPVLLSRLVEKSYLARLMTFWNRESMLVRTNYLTPTSIGLTLDNGGQAVKDINGIFGALVALRKRFGFELLIIPVPTKDGARRSLEILKKNVSKEVLNEASTVNVTGIVDRLVGDDNRQYGDLFWRHDAHFNSYGNYIFGRAVAEALRNEFNNWPERKRLMTNGRNLSD